MLVALVVEVNGAFFNWDREKSLKIERRVGWLVDLDFWFLRVRMDQS